MKDTAPIWAVVCCYLAFVCWACVVVFGQNIPTQRHAIVQTMERDSIGYVKTFLTISNDARTSGTITGAQYIGALSTLSGMMTYGDQFDWATFVEAYPTSMSLVTSSLFKLSAKSMIERRRLAEDVRRAAKRSEQDSQIDE